MAQRIQVIDDDRVFCRRRQRDVDLEMCLACRDLEEVRSDGNVDVVVCTGMPKKDRDLETLIL